MNTNAIIELILAGGALLAAMVVGGLCALGLIVWLAGRPQGRMK